MNKIHNILIASGIAAFVYLIPLCANATLLVYEGFDYGPGSIAGKTPSGSSSAWYGTGSGGSASGGTADVNAVGADYNGLLTTGGSLHLTPESADLQITLDHAFTGIQYVSFLAQQTNDGTRFVNFGLIGVGSQRFWIGRQGGQDEQWRYWADGVTETIPGTSVQDLSLVVLKVDMNAQDVSIYLNPEVGAPENTAAALTIALPSSITSLSAVRFGAGYVRGGATTATAMFDELRIGTSYESVLPAIPESSTTGLALAFVAAVGVLALRRRGRGSNRS